MKQFEMTKDQHDKLMDACKSVPMIALQCGPTPSPQERANAAWKSLGDELGFDHMTVRPVTGRPETAFMAEPK